MDYERLILEDSLSSYITSNSARFKFVINLVINIFENLDNNVNLDPNPKVEFTDIEDENLRDFVMIMKMKIANDDFVDVVINFFMMEMKTDVQFAEKVRSDIYEPEKFLKILYFMLFKPETNLIKIGSKFEAWAIDSNYEKKKKFEEIESEEKILFHGTKSDRLYSIISTSLRNFSGTKYMKTGNIHGNGIYLSNNFNTAMLYSDRGKGYVLVVRCKNLNRKQDDIFVQNEEDILICGVIFYDILSGVLINHEIDELSEELVQRTKLQTVSRNGVISSANVVSSKRFTREINSLKSENRPKQIISVCFENGMNSALLIELQPVEGSDLFLDCKKYGIPGILIAMYFPEKQNGEYPFSPPLVRVVRPIFKVSTGRVSRGGAICMDQLFTDGWSPTLTIESLCLSIINLISTESQINSYHVGGLVDETRLNVEYQFEDFYQSLGEISMIHKWTIAK